MTVADNTSRNQYTATSGQTVFAYTFEIVDKDDIVVLKNGTTLSEGTDYTVSNVGNDSGGNVTLTTGATTGDILTLYRDMPYARTQNYINSGDFLASEVNSDFDNLWLASEQINRGFTQSVRKPITDSDSVSMELPSAADRANKVLSFDSTGAVEAIDELSGIAYETGTWTPVLTDSASSGGGNPISKTVREASYTKIGNMVFLSCDVDGLNTSGATGSNDFVVTGLPYAPKGSASFNFFVGTAVWDGVSGGPYAVEIVRATGPALTYLRFPVLTKTTTGPQYLEVGDIVFGGDFHIQLNYLTDG